MIKELNHYGKKVTRQVIDIPFKGQLCKAGIDYIEVPNLEHDIVSYKWEGKERYAIIKQFDGFERVYITDSVPMDANWELLLRDCEDQMDGKEPMKMKTKAKMILDRACENAAELCQGKEIDFFAPKEPTILDIKFAIARLGYSAEEIKKMVHYDVDDDFLKRICE